MYSLKKKIRKKEMDPPPDPPLSQFSFTADTLKQRQVPTKESIHKEPVSETKSSPEETESSFECNICLDTASQPVVSLCGHLYCWPCIHEWMISGVAGSLACPVCKSGLETKDKLIPIYTPGKDNKDPRQDIPERPQGQRSTPPPPPPQNPFFPGLFPGFQFTAGNVAFHVGAFGLMPLAFQGLANAFAVPPPPPQPGHAQEAMIKNFIARMLMMISVLTFLMILLY